MVATTNIPGLPVGLALTGTEIFPAVQNGVDRRFTISQISTFFNTSAAAVLTFQAPLQRNANIVSLNGFTAQADNGVVYRASSAAVGVTAAGTIGALLMGNGTAAPPSWVSAGTTGQLLVGTTGAQPVWIPAGISAQILVATNGQPVWSSVLPGAAGVDTFSAGVTGFTPTSPTTGNVVLGGVLLPGSGGTGVTTATGTGPSTVLSTQPSILSAQLTTPTIIGALTYGGVVLSAAVTGTGAMVLQTQPSILSAALTTPAIGVATGTSLLLTGGATTFNATAIPAGGTTGTGVRFSNTANFGTFFGSGVPTLTAAAGSLYYRSDSPNEPYYSTGPGTWTILASLFNLVVRVTSFTASATWNVNANTVVAVMEAWGGGGGGGGCAAPASTFAAGGTGGGAGSYSRTTSSKATVGTSQSITIGAAGLAGTAGANPGGNGGDTSVGSLCIGKGGSGGQANSSAGGATPTGGLGGVAGTGDIVTTGDPGGAGLVYGAVQIAPGAKGGSSSVGGGGLSVLVGASAAANGNPGTGHGSGGGGGSTLGNSATAVSGGAGGAGYVVITEYCTQ
jgi:hypothetical protein